MPRDRNATRRDERWRSVHETSCWLLAAAPRQRPSPFGQPHPARRAGAAGPHDKSARPAPAWLVRLPSTDAAADDPISRSFLSSLIAAGADRWSGRGVAGRSRRYRRRSQTASAEGAWRPRAASPAPDRRQAAQARAASRNAGGGDHVRHASRRGRTAAVRVVGGARWMGGRGGGQRAGSALASGLVWPGSARWRATRRDERLLGWLAAAALRVRPRPTRPRPTRPRWGCRLVSSRCTPAPSLLTPTPSLPSPSPIEKQAAKIIAKRDRE